MYKILNKKDFEEIKENLEFEMYEVLEKRDDILEMNFTLVEERGKVFMALEYDNGATFRHRVLTEDFKEMDLDEMNKLINQVNYYGIE